jgi:hypothetical protein
MTVQGRLTPLIGEAVVDKAIATAAAKQTNLSAVYTAELTVVRAEAAWNRKGPVIQRPGNKTGKNCS